MICQLCGEEFKPRENEHLICSECEGRLMYEDDEENYYYCD